MATVSQILNMNDHELGQKCGFLGHNISVHREFYRLPQDTLHLAKASRLLMAAESGQIAQFQGKSLEEIQLDQNLEFHDSEVECDGISEDDEEAPSLHEAESESIRQSVTHKPSMKKNFRKCR